MENQKNEISPRNLFDVFNKFIQLKDERILILYIDLYIEYFIHKLYDEALRQNRIILKRGLFSKIFDCCNKKVGSPRTKIKILVKNKVIDPMFLEIILLIFKLRQELVHNLEPNKKLLEKWINDHKPPVEEIDGLITKFLNKADPWDKIQLFAFPAVFTLYKNLLILKKEKLPQYLEFHINPEATGIMIVLKNIP
jgi:hypothetical protein